MSERGIQEACSSLGKTIMKDYDTTDCTIRCETREFKVHRNILCARSSVLRSSILDPTQEATNCEIFEEDVGEKALSSVIEFLYTGELELGEDPDIEDLSLLGTMYLLPGFMDLLALRLQMWKEEFSGEMIADIVIAAHRHESEYLREIAMDKIRGNKKIFNDPGFRNGMKDADPSIMIDLFKDL